ncbi:MAG: protein kinase [Kofleriaceae bacterium]
MLGAVIGNFRVVSLLGRGGMGEVYVAEHVGIQTRVAVKVLLPEISKHEPHVHRLFNEARIVSRIKHAGITKIFDVGFHDGQAYLVMEYLEGEALGRRIARQGRLSIGELADFGRQVASVLGATHGAGITHRDLKPDNIFLVADDELERHERVKVLDFGIAKLPNSGGPQTIGTMGTPEYMAPEQWGDSGSVDWRADAYALGCVLFEMASGRPPFPSSTIAEAYTQHTQAMPPRLTDVPPEIDRMIQQLLAKDPMARGESMHAIARALEPWVTSTEAARASGSHPVVGRARTTLGDGAGQVGRVDNVKRTGVLAGVAAIAAIVGIAIASGRIGHNAAASQTSEAVGATSPAPAAHTPPQATQASSPGTSSPQATQASQPAPASSTALASPPPVSAPAPTTVLASPPVSAPTPAPTKPTPSATKPTPKPTTKPKPKSEPAPTPAPAPRDELEGRT